MKKTVIILISIIAMVSCSTNNVESNEVFTSIEILNGSKAKERMAQLNAITEKGEYVTEKELVAGIEVEKRVFKKEYRQGTQSFNQGKLDTYDFSRIVKSTCSSEVYELLLCSHVKGGVISWVDVDGKRILYSYDAHKPGRVIILTTTLEALKNY